MWENKWNKVDFVYAVSLLASDIGKYVLLFLPTPGARDRALLVEQFPGQKSQPQTSAYATPAPSPEQRASGQHWWGWKVGPRSFLFLRHFLPSLCVSLSPCDTISSIGFLRVSFTADYFVPFLSLITEASELFRFHEP